MYKNITVRANQQHWIIYFTALSVTFSTIEANAGIEAVLTDLQRQQ